MLKNKWRYDLKQGAWSSPDQKQCSITKDLFDASGGGGKEKKKNDPLINPSSMYTTGQSTRYLIAEAALRNPKCLCLFNSHKHEKDMAMTSAERARRRRRRRRSKRTRIEEEEEEEEEEAKNRLLYFEGTLFWGGLKKRQKESHHFGGAPPFPSTRNRRHNLLGSRSPKNQPGSCAASHFLQTWTQPTAIQNQIRQQ